MAINASRSYIRMSPRKIRDVARLVRGKDAKKSLATLMLTRKNAAEVIAKVLKQAIANANNQGIGGSLKISRLEIGEGPRYKRFRAVSRGMAHTIIKKTAHIKMELLPSIQNINTSVQKNKKTELAKVKNAEVVVSSSEIKSENKTGTKKIVKKAVKSAEKVKKTK